jgi:hypothetical protein
MEPCPLGPHEKRGEFGAMLMYNQESRCLLTLHRMNIRRIVKIQENGTGEEFGNLTAHVSAPHRGLRKV